MEAATFARRWSPVRAHAAACLIAGTSPRMPAAAPELGLPEGERNRRAG